MFLRVERIQVSVAEARAIDVLRAGAGQPQFVRGADLRSYVGGVLVRIFAIAYLADQFVRSGIAACHSNARMPMHDGILLRLDEIDLPIDELVRPFGLGTFLAKTDQDSHNALEFFMEAGEAIGGRGFNQPLQRTSLEY
jgi:hypothetical protein